MRFWAVFAILAPFLLNSGNPATAQPAQQQAPAAPAQPAPAPTAAQAEAEAKARQAEIAALVMERANREMGLNVDETVGRWGRDLDRIDQSLRNPKINGGQIDVHRQELDRIRSAAGQFLGALQPRLDGVTQQLEKLGAGPQAGQPPEPENVARNRAELNGVRGLYNAAKGLAETAATRSNQLISLTQDLRRARFTSRLSERTPGTYDPENWAKLPENFSTALAKAGETIQDWWRGLGTQGGRDAQTDALQIFGFTVLLWVGLIALGWRRIPAVRTWPEGEEPPFWKRAASAASVIALRALPLTLPAIFLYNAFAAAELLNEKTSRLLYSACRSILILSVVYALISTVMAPKHPRWRVIPASDGAAWRIYSLVVALAVIYALHAFQNTVGRVTSAPFALTVLQSFIASVLVSLLTIAIIRTRMHGTSVEGAPELKGLKLLRMPVWILALTILAAALTGYIGLSRFLATQLVVTGTILSVVYLLMIWVDALGQSMKDEEAATGQWLKATFGFDQNRREQLALPVTLTLKLFILLGSVPLILLQWGFNWRDVIDWFYQLFFGFRIGNTQISIAAILASVIVFVLGYLGAKLFQGWLDKQVLKPAGLSGSARDSIRTTVGYIGVFIAGLVAFSYAGFDLSNLAIVAGAFSVGVGFGLQSVISNFVSGLILLAERPIKVGDWVVVGGEEGLVRKISVRSTEIETFDRANVLVPNSYFITETVKNWTLHNNTGRITIKIGVGYDSDPRQVRDILLKVAKDNLNVMTNPEPFVDFDEFGSDALNFKLFAYVYDLGKAGNAKTDIRIAIMEEFRKAGIEIPYRQTEVALKDMEWLKEAVSNYVAVKGNGAAATG